MRPLDPGPGPVLRALLTLIGGATAATVGLMGLRGVDLDHPSLVDTVVGSAIGGLSVITVVLSENSASRLGLRPASARAWALACGLPLFNIGFSSAWVWLLAQLGATNVTQSLMTEMQGSAGLPLTLGLVYAVLGAPLVEELTFRGLLQGWIGERRGPLVGSLSAGLMFGLMHLADPVAVLPLMLFGVALGELRRRGGGIGPCLLAHAGNNLLAVIVGLGA